MEIAEDTQGYPDAGIVGAQHLLLKRQRLA
jgi:hypothetical protein